MKEKYISCNSASAFKLNFNLKNGLKWRVKNITLNAATNTNAYCTLLGGRVSTGDKDFQVTKTSGGVFSGFSRAGSSVNNVGGMYVSIFEPYTWIYEAGVIKFEYKGNVVYQTERFSEDLDGGVVSAVGALNGNGRLGQFWNGEIFSVLCEDSDGVLLCDLKADNIDGVWGMEDSVTGNFYTSETETPFGGGVWTGGY